MEREEFSFNMLDRRKLIVVDTSLISISRVSRTHVVFPRQDSHEDFTPVHICATREHIRLVDFYFFFATLKSR